MSGDEWARVGQEVRTRRESLDLTQKAAALAAGLSDTTWLVLESGKPVSARSGRLACKALGWSSDSIDRLLRGEEVEPAPAAETTEGGDLSERVSRLETQVADLVARIDAALDVLPPGRPQDGRP